MEPISSIQLGALAAKTAIIMLVLFLGFRVLGKRQVAQLNLYDLAMIMAISNAVQNAMTSGRGNLGIGLVTSTTVVLIAWFATRLFLRAPRLEERFIGSPAILLNRGKILKARLRRERISKDELTAALRAHGLAHANEAEMAVLEVDGSISVIPRSPCSSSPLEPPKLKD